jgi:pimeloyl-ACP methyl ester carboxylesterase
MTTAPSRWFESVRSGDVELFYRLYGDPGDTPLLILHGANYYDSEDWVQVAEGLAAGRQVCAYDARGYGRSSWSPSQDYSLDAQLGDIEALLDHLGWERAVFVGHSRGGSFSLRFAHERPQRVAGLVLVDFAPGRAPGRPGVEPLRLGAWGPVYGTLEQAHAATSRDPGELSTESGHALVGSIFAERDGGWVNVRRDPAFQSERPKNRVGLSPGLAPIDPWDSLRGLASAEISVLAIRATWSSSYGADTLLRLRTEFDRVQIVDVDCGHDVPGAAPCELIAALSAFLVDTAR